MAVIGIGELLSLIAGPFPGDRVLRRRCVTGGGNIHPSIRLFHLNRARKQDIVLEVNVPVEIRFKFRERLQQRLVTGAGIRRRHEAMGSFAQASKASPAESCSCSIIITGFCTLPNGEGTIGAPSRTDSSMRST